MGACLSFSMSGAMVEAFVQRGRGLDTAEKGLMIKRKKSSATNRKILSRQQSSSCYFASMFKGEVGHGWLC